MDANQVVTFLEQLGGGRTDPTTIPLDAFARLVRAEWPPEPPSSARLCEDLVGRPSAHPARDWHLARLCELLRERVVQPGSVVPERVRYHANWLLYLGSTDGKRKLKVSIVVPIYNRAWLAADLVENCLAQTYSNIEIVVVDDGSTDDLSAALAPFRSRVKLVCQPNSGVSAARNAGIAAATGDFVQFLDSDNLLRPDCIRRKLDAFAAIPDADLCYCGPIEAGLFGMAPRLKFGTAYEVPVGDSHCPTNDLLTAIIERGYPFLTTSIMMPRWVLLDCGPFEIDLRRAEDARYWFRLAVRGTKVIGLQQRLFYRTYLEDGLNARRSSDLATTEIVRLRNLVELLQRPPLWTLAVHYLLSRNNRTVWERFLEGDDDDPATARDRKALHDAVLNLGGCLPENGLSPLPFLVFLSLYLAQIGSHPSRWSAFLKPQFRSVLARAALKAIRHASPVSSRDEEDWRRHVPGTSAKVKLRRVLNHQRPRFAPWAQRDKVRAAYALMRRSVGLEAPQEAKRNIVPSGLAAQTTPKATLIVPALEDPEAAERTVSSCLAQSFSPLEILVLDVVPSRAKRWGERFPSVTAIPLADSRGGLAYARSAGVSEARGSLVRLLVPGDELTPDSIARQVEALDNTDQGTIAIEMRLDDNPTGKAGVCPLSELLARRIEPPLSAMLLPRALVREVGGFDQVLGGAHEIRYRMRLAASGATCRLVAASGSVPAAEPTAPAAEVMLAAAANLAEAARSKALSCCVLEAARMLGVAASRMAVRKQNHDLNLLVCNHLVRTVRRLAHGQQGDDSAALPSLALCVAGFEWGCLASSDDAATVEIPMRAAVFGAAAAAVRRTSDHSILSKAVMNASAPAALKRAVMSARKYIAEEQSSSPLIDALGQLKAALIRIHESRCA